MAKVKTGEVEVIPERRVEKTKTVCDMCGQEITNRRGVYEAVDVDCSLGTIYADETEIDYFREFDICGECFKSKLAPFIENFGSQLRGEAR